MDDEDRRKVILQITAWQRVTGDLREITQSFYKGRPEQQREIASAVEEFIEKIEEEFLDL